MKDEYTCTVCEKKFNNTLWNVNAFSVKEMNSILLRYAQNNILINFETFLRMWIHCLRKLHINDNTM